MSGDDTFIARWARLKQQAADEKKKPSARAGAENRQKHHPDSERAAEAEAGRHIPPKPTPDAEPPFDLASLPPIESIVAGTDIRAFLQKGVPAALTKAALRRAWTTDPAIRDFIEVAENQWDFTDPAAIPGFGPLQATDNLRQLVGQALGNLPEAQDAPGVPDASGTPQESPDAIASAKVAPDAPPHAAKASPKGPSTEPSPMHEQVVAPEERVDNRDTGAVAALQHPLPAHPVGDVPRRKGHGGAIPR